MAFTVKNWENSPSTATPISAEALEDAETRLSNYTEALVPKVMPQPVDQVTPVTDMQMLAYQQSTGKFIFKDPFFVDPADGSWGAVGYTIDSLPAFQAAVNYAIMGNTVDPALAAAKPMAGRTAKWPVKVGGRPDIFGTFRFDSKLKIYGVNGFKFEGSGAYNTVFRSGSVGQDHIIDVNGCFNSVFRDFGVNADPTGDCTSCLNVDSLPTVSKLAGEFNLFENIAIGGNARYVHGITVGALGPSNAQDTAHCRFNHVWVSGAQPDAINFTATTTSGSAILTSVSSISGLANGNTVTGRGIPASTTIVDVNFAVNQIQLSANATISNTGVGIMRAGWDTPTWWQTGIKVGGPFGVGNVLQHIFHGCDIAHHVRGLDFCATGILWRDGWMLSNGTCIYMSGAGGVSCASLFEGFRVESSGRLLDGVGGSSTIMLTLRDIAFTLNIMAADCIVARFTAGGQFVMDNIQFRGQYAARNDQPLVNIGCSLGGQMCDFRSLTIESPTLNPNPVVWLTNGAPRRGSWRVSGIAASTIGSFAVDKPLAGPISNRDRDAPLMSFSATATSASAVLVSGSSTASANVREGSTITGPNIPAATTISSISGNNITMSAAATGSGTATHATIVYAAHLSDRYIGVVSTVTGGATVNLPAVATVTPGHELVVMDESGTAATNNITIDGSGAETINGAATNVISTNYGKVKLKCTGTAWVVI